MQTVGAFESWWSAKRQLGKLRVDKWLWYARFFKTRTLAAEVANGGKIRVNKVAVRKASADVKVGDVLTFHQGHNIRVIEILGLGSARRPFEEAKLLYNAIFWIVL